MPEQVPGAGSERPEDEAGREGAASFWLRNLPHPSDRPEEPVWRGLPGLSDEEPEPEPDDIGPWEPFFSNRPVWRRRRLFTLLSFLTFVGLLFILVNPLDALQWLAGPEDPPLRVIDPGQLTQEQPGGDWIALPAGAQVQPGSFLKSNRDRTAVLRVRGGGSLRLDEGASLRVMRLLRREDESYQIRSMLYQGRAFVRELSTDTLPVETVFTRIQPQNATYEVGHLQGPDGNYYTQVRVYAGRVHVGLARGQTPDVVLEARQSIRVTFDRLGTVQPIEENDDWETWNLSWSNTDLIPPYIDRGSASPGPGAPDGSP